MKQKTDDRGQRTEDKYLSKRGRICAILVAIFALFLTFSTHARAADNTLYSVSDVAVDVTADSAAHARDQAVTQAQRDAFGQLLERLGVESVLGAKLSDDDIATLVQNFEVQNERTSSVRYIGTFTVQFKPNAVRSWLNSRGAYYTEQRSPPVVVLPVYDKNGHPVLWEESSRWRAAWDAVPHAGGLVPVIIPSGGLDDISAISTAEAVSGSASSIAALIGKYQAGGAAIVTLKGDIDKPDGNFSIEIRHYGEDGGPTGTDSLTFTAPADKTALDPMLAQEVKQTIHLLEKHWKQQLRNGSNSPAQPDLSAEALAKADVSIQNEIPMQTELPVEQPAGTIEATVPIATLAQWAQIQRKIAATPGVNHVNVITLQRGVVDIGIQYRGHIEDVQTALLQRNLQLKQDTMSGAWFLNPF